ncbi:hypothetical protein P280DRAFT_480558 [Massarina eburnea CBS 473.64]|uniref:Uncharacterized protein n=1 Tax=Massarina eburnea CBS 473.64 TaxID=1395130 RepID=A0A6A6RY04_9PLEO|nr:hypothetical protein P280DRAFT_480558 [Massarina eburnea CBS 473.64]
MSRYPPPRMNCLHVMGEELAIAEPQVIFPEAKRQYEALLQEQVSDNHNDTSPAIDVSRFYRTHYKVATRDLDEEQKAMLQHVCFAYKTKSRVLEFLDLLEPEICEWAEPLMAFVKEFGRDTNFADEEDGVDTAAAASGVENMEKSTAFIAQAALSLPSPPVSSDPPMNPMAPQLVLKPYFIIPTLPLAIPADFFSSLGHHAPIGHLDVQSLLTYPSALQIAFTNELKDKICTATSEFWKPTKALRHGAGYRKSKKSWKAFFRHLMEGEFRLVTRRDGMLGHDRDGYTMTDLNLWLARWVADRMTTGTSEFGVQLRETLRQSPKKPNRPPSYSHDDGDVGAKSDTSSSDDDDDHDDELEAKRNTTTRTEKSKPRKAKHERSRTGTFSPSWNRTGAQSPEAKERVKAWNERKARLVKEGLGGHELVEKMLEWTRRQTRSKRLSLRRNKRMPGF